MEAEFPRTLAAPAMLLLALPWCQPAALLATRRYGNKEKVPANALSLNFRVSGRILLTILDYSQKHRAKLVAAGRAMTFECLNGPMGTFFKKGPFYRVNYFTKTHLDSLADGSRSAERAMLEWDERRTI